MAKTWGTPEEIARTLYRYDQSAAHYYTLNDLENEDFRRQYRQEGFAAMKRILTDQEVDEALRALEELIFVDAKGAHLQFTKPQAELPTREERELALRKLSDFVECEARLKAVAHHPVLLRAIEVLIGEKPKLVQDMAMMKPPHGGGEKPWHQDMAYGRLAYDRPVIGVWIALDEAGLDNGCMHVIPGSHMKGATPHYAERDWQLCDTHVPVERDVAVPLSPGELMFFHGLTVHGTPPNHSAKRRRALQFHYVAESAKKLTPQEYKRMFTNELTGAEC